MQLVTGKSDREEFERYRELELAHAAALRDEPTATPPAELTEHVHHRMAETQRAFDSIDAALGAAHPGWVAAGFDRGAALYGEGDVPMTARLRHHDYHDVVFVVVVTADERVERLEVRFGHDAQRATSSAMKRLAWGQLMAAARTYLRLVNISATGGYHPDLGDRSEELAEMWSAPRPKRRTRPPEYDEHHFACVARDYAAETADHRVSSLADRYSVSRSTMRGWVAKARALGFLTAPPAPNTAGGRLTRKAVAILNESREV